MLEGYKKNPWVNRQFGTTSAGSQKRRHVQVTIDLSRADFDNTEELWIRHGIASFLDIPAEQVKVVSIKEGSVQVVLSLPEFAANKLLELAQSQMAALDTALAPLRIIGVNAVTSVERTAASGRSTTIDLEDIPLAALAGGDQSAWDKVFHSLWPRIITFLRSRGSTTVDAEDIAISVIEGIYRMRDRIETASFIPHLAFAIARHRLEDSYRMALRSRPESRLRISLTELAEPTDDPALQLDESGEPSRAIEVAEATNLLRKAMHELDETTRAMIEDRFIGELTFQEMAEKRGIKEKVVRQRVYRGMKKLRESIRSSPELGAELKSILKQP